MIQRFVHHVRGNVVGYLALFVALGGTSYAATALPGNSVGSRQLRSGSVTPGKLAPRSFGGHIMLTAQISAVGQVVSSTPKGAQVVFWNSSSTQLPDGGNISWHRSIPSRCFVLADAQGQPLGTSGYPPWAAANVLAGSAKRAQVAVFTPGPAEVYVAVICP